MADTDYLISIFPVERQRNFKKFALSLSRTRHLSRTICELFGNRIETRDIISGEHRLPACRSRQLAETGEMVSRENCVSKDVAGRAAGNYRLAACAPRKMSETLAQPGITAHVARDIWSCGSHNLEA